MGKEVEHFESCSHYCVCMCVCVGGERVRACVCAHAVIRSDNRPQMPTGVISTPSPLLFPFKGTKRGSSGRLLQECCTSSL